MFILSCVEKDKKLMDLAEFEAVLKEVAPLAEIVCLHLLGEPLAHPRFSEFWISANDTIHKSI